MKGILLTLAIGFGNMCFTTLNEYVDYEVDKVSKPWKPLPSGIVTLKTTKAIIVVSFIVSLISLISLRSMFYIAIGFIGYIASFMYNYVRKDLVGNLFLSIAYGTASLMCLYPKYLTFSLAFAIFTVSFNILVQYQDMVIERAIGIITAPQQLGKHGTVIVSSLLSIINFVILCLLYSETMYTPILLLMAIPPLLMIASLSIHFGLPLSIIEWTNRRISRAILIIAFLLMTV